MGDKRNAYKILGEKPVGKTPLGSYRHRWSHGLKIDLKNKRRGCGIHLAQDRGKWPVLIEKC
jgi:hypothetical protein